MSFEQNREALKAKTRAESIVRKKENRSEEYEYNLEDSASIISACVILIVGMILFAIEYYLKDIVNVSLITLGVTAIGTDTLYKGIAFKKAWKIVIGILLSLIALMMIIARVVL